mgnify:CR=1 FL=1
MVFRDPAGRRRRALRTALMALTLAWVVLVALIVVGLTGLHPKSGAALTGSSRRDDIGASASASVKPHLTPTPTPTPTPTRTLRPVRPVIASTAGMVAPPEHYCHQRACADRGCLPLRVTAPERRVGSVEAAFDADGVAPPGDISAGDFDCRGFSFNARQLAADGFGPGDKVVADGQALTLPRVAARAADEINTAGQVIKVTAGLHATELGFLGAGEYGTRGGTVTVTYAGGATQRSDLRLADWYADWPAPGSMIAAAAPWNIPPAHAAKFRPAPVAVYYAQIRLNPAMTITSVTLPDDRDLHLFDVGVPAVASYASLSSAFDDTALVPAAAALDGNYDGDGHSYDSASLSAAGLRPGASVTVQGVRFRWPDYRPGHFDNVRAEGQSIAVSGSGRVLGFLGSATTGTRSTTTGTQSGTVRIQYADGSVQSATLTFASWQANHAADGGRVVATVPWNRASGASRKQVSVYSAVLPLRPGRTVASVTLPVNFYLHVFAIAVGG